MANVLRLFTRSDRHLSIPDSTQNPLSFPVGKVVPKGRTVPGFSESPCTWELAVLTYLILGGSAPISILWMHSFSQCGFSCLFFFYFKPHEGITEWNDQNELEGSIGLISIWGGTLEFGHLASSFWTLAQYRW